MALKTSLVLAGDATGAVNALQQTETGLNQAAGKAAELSAAYAQADRAGDRLAAAQATAKAETMAAKAAFDAGTISIRAYNSRLIETKSALGLIEAEHRTAVAAVKQLRTANDTIAPSFRQAQAGAVNFSRQVQDVAMQLQLGANIGTVIAMQGGQVADSVAQMGGRFAGLARFMAGPWGTAIIVATSLLANLAQSMWENAKAADENAGAISKVALATDGMKEAQSVLGEIFDLTTGKIKSQNEMLLLNAKLTAMNLRSEALSERTQSQRVLGFDQSGLGLSTVNRIMGMFGVDVSDDFGRSRSVRDLAQRVRSGRTSERDALGEVEKLDFTGLKVTKDEFITALVQHFTNPLKEKQAGLIEASIENLALDPSFRKTGKDSPRRSSRDTSGAPAEAGEDAAKKIANIRDQFSDLPSAIERSKKALRELDDIASDVARSKLPQQTKTALVGAIDEARTAINDSLNKPLDDYIAKAREAAEIDKLLIAGRDDEAAALRDVLGLKKQIPALDKEQLSTVLATVQAERQRALVLRDQRALIDANIRAVHDMRGALEQTVADALRGRFSVSNILRSIGNSYINITAQRIVEKMFGDTLRAIEERATATGKVDAAATGMATAMGKGSNAVTDLARAVEQAIPRIEAAAAGEPPPPANDNGEPGDIIVTGKRPTAQSGQDAGSLVVDLVTGLAREIGIKIPKEVGDGVKQALAKLEKGLPSVLAGAITGASASRIVLGDRGTGGTIGSAIGGAIGEKVGEKFLSKGFESIAKGLGGFAGPLGSIAGGLLGGLVGGLFQKKNWGSAAITGGGEGDISATGTNSSRSSAASGMAGSVQDALANIADEFGAEIGRFNVSIGTYKDKYRVNVTGGSKMGGSKNNQAYGIYDFGDDQAAAIAFATLDALKDGALQGLSAAVQKALTSSSDLNKGIREALKVREVERLIEGLGGSLRQQFADLEKEAKDRLRIARQYGLDVAAVEQVNAKERLALTEKLLKEQTGSLQNLIDEITSGSLFEGSAVDRRKAILAQIDTAKADADAGKEGAADTLAQLLQDLNAVSKEVFGTTGGFAADQAAILDQARDSIAKANQRIQEAQKATSDPALAETNRQLDESNDQLARIAAAMNVSVDYLKAIAANGNTATYSALRAAAGY